MEQISAEVGRILRSPEVIRNFTAQRVTPAPNTPAEFDKFIAAEIERLGMVVKSAGIQLE